MTQGLVFVGEITGRIDGSHLGPRVQNREHHI
jgi:hypothetical protein